MRAMQKAISCALMRGGTSRGPFFLASDLPSEVAARDRVLLAAMGSPDNRQIDGLGGADPLTSKVGIVSLSAEPGVDIDFLFAQVLINEARVDTTPNCGNMLAAALPFALEKGLVQAQGAHTTLRVRTLNTGALADITVETPNGFVKYEGSAKIDGVPGTSAPVKISFLDTEGSVCGKLLPTGNVVDVFDGVEVTCIDNGMPVVVLRAADVGKTGRESRDALNADAPLKAKLESIRLQAGRAMGLGDVTKKVVPKMTLVSPATQGGALATRTFIPHDCHASIGVLGAVTVATAAMLRGSSAHALSKTKISVNGVADVSVEHPTGEFTVQLTMDATQPERVASAALLRTARLIMRGEVMVNADLLTEQAK
jgi:4-oxalomesaconate tautomerase